MTDDLAQRLIDAASDAFDVGTFNYEAQVAAVLRVLDHEVMLRTLGEDPPVDLCELANEVERVAR